MIHERLLKTCIMYKLMKIGIDKMEESLTVCFVVFLHSLLDLQAII